MIWEGLFYKVEAWCNEKFYDCQAIVESIVLWLINLENDLDCMCSDPINFTDYKQRVNILHTEIEELL